MPVSQLFVEGTLDAEVLRAVFKGNPVVELGGSKNSLAPRTITERQVSKTNVCYLRDRDFDYNPPMDLSQPVVDRMYAGTVLGWHWCRHEIENYLIEPAMVAAALGWDVATYSTELIAAAQRIRHYQAARWAVGIARRGLPPNYELQTRPIECADHDFHLPNDLTEVVVFQWARDHVANFHGKVNQVLAPATVESSLTTQGNCFTDAFLGSVANIVIWFSGKDLLASLESWLKTQGLPNVGAFRAAMRDWVRNHPDDALNYLVEWKNIRDLLGS